MVAAILDRRHLGDLEGARAAPLHRDRRRARRVGAVRADRAVLRLPARAHGRRGEPLDEHALAGVPVRRQPRLARRSRSRPSARSPTTCSRRWSTGRGWCSSSAGLRHCVDTDRLDEDGFPRPVGPHDPARDVCRDHLAAGPRRPRRLRAAVPAPAGRARRSARPSTTRCARARRPLIDRQFAGYRVDKADSPAVDIQQAGGAFQRLTFAVDRVPRRARRGRAARLPVAGGDPRPGRRARAARVRAGRAGDRDLPGRRARVLPRAG